MAGKKLLSARIPDELVKDLKHLSVELDRLMEDVLAEGVRDLLRKYNYKRPSVQRRRKDIEID